MKKRSVSICLLAGVAMMVMASPSLADINGLWSTVDGKSRVSISTCGNRFCGEIVWLKEPNDAKGKPKTDLNNQDEKLKLRPILGLKLLHSFKPSGEMSWDDGKIYNPEDGKIYSSHMKLINEDILEVKGCVFIFCKSQVWNRVAE